MMNVENEEPKNIEGQVVITGLAQTNVNCKETSSLSDDESEFKSTSNIESHDDVDNNNGPPPVPPHSNNEEHQQKQYSSSKRSSLKGVPVIIQQRYGASAYEMTYLIAYLLIFFGFYKMFLYKLLCCKFLATTTVPYSSAPTTPSTKLESIKSWTISTYKCSRQTIFEKLGKSSKTVDSELEAQIESLRETQKKYSNILRLSRGLTSHLYHVIQTQVRRLTIVNLTN